ncbi:WD40 repeat-containing protein [Heterostelium album PN500]|uniref:WD40 repeat-containing protein n=1 Tax=Heterostelium pallidum (strain ATCC 26659 / Pp 5 / PN500) TaxID=670386 RepID=D3AXF0_HETP5|nr:WD40 repeat-containing protein [Heterostelium album PN500]EFA86219.1 WD40 repeat-containing protein [Heterostelium album PN500]|eukprot:XP_020438324.1 WD40 repeat-containing protein [Heterostelium album PN500]
MTNKSTLIKKRPFETNGTQKNNNNKIVQNKNINVKQTTQPTTTTINKKLKTDTNKSKVKQVQQEAEEEEEIEEEEVDEEVDEQEDVSADEEVEEEEEEEEEEEYIEEQEIQYKHKGSESDSEEEEEEDGSEEDDNDEEAEGNGTVDKIKDIEYTNKNNKQENGHQTEKPTNGSAWVDDDDDETNEDNKINNVLSGSLLPKWAKKEEQEKQDDQDEDDIDIQLENKVFHSDRKITSFKGEGHINTKITVKRGIAQHVSRIEYSGVSNMILLVHTAGITLFSSYNLDKPLYSSILKGFGCSSAMPLPNSNECIIIGHKSHYYVYNMKTVALKKYTLRVGDNYLRLLCVSNDYYAICDSLGKISILSCKSKTLVKEVQLSQKDVSLMRFSADGEHLYVVSQGWITVYDSKKDWRIVHRFKDHGNVTSKSILSIAFSPNNSYFATGSESGIVNVYERVACLASESPQPLHVISSLVSPVTDLQFSPNNAMLLMSSSTDKGIVRILSVPDFKVVSWCDANTMKLKLGAVTSSSFTNDCRVLYLTNDKGAIIKVRGFK